MLVLLSLSHFHPLHCAEPLQPSTNRTPASVTDLLPAWTKFYRLGVGSGYKDNLLLGPNRREVGGFANFFGDLIVWRRPMEDRREWQILASASQRRYWADRSLDKEGEAIAIARGFQPIGSLWDLVLESEAAWFDQVIDGTFTDQVILRQRLQGGSIKGMIGLRRKMGERSFLHFGPSLGRLWLRSPFDNHLEAGGLVGWAQNYGNRSEFKAEYFARRRTYDSLEETDLSGQPLGGRTRSYQRHGLQLSDTHNWDAARDWNSSTRFSIEQAVDEAAGYWDHHRLRVYKSLRWIREPWETQLDAGWMFDSFPNQTTTEAIPSRRVRSEINIGIRIERKLGNFMKAYGEWRHEQSLASDPIERYVANTFSIGALWDF
ncbi:MAG: hypothetical protein FJ405_12845 [Verrucomicrobia bacterium]|nr:hypothetical protein [Verrucomicrobiota bacterium]